MPAYTNEINATQCLEQKAHYPVTHIILQHAKDTTSVNHNRDWPHSLRFHCSQQCTHTAIFHNLLSVQNLHHIWQTPSWSISVTSFFPVVQVCFQWCYFFSLYHCPQSIETNRKISKQSTIHGVQARFGHQHITSLSLQRACYIRQQYATVFLFS